MAAISEPNKRPGLSAAEWFYCLLTAGLLLAFCSRSSPLYPFNYWTDANCFFTVGKSMMKGLVTYRDIYEQKGPLLYFVHGLAYLISKDSFTGVYLLEVAAVGAFLKSIISILRYYSVGLPHLLAAVLGSLILASPGFALGDSAEELCLPLISWSLYFLLRLGREEDKDKGLSLPLILLTGIFAGCILLIKFSLLGFHLGWIYAVFILMIYRKGFLCAVKSVLVFLAGIVIIALPFYLYFRLNNALDDLWTAYFYNNIFLYPVQENGEQSRLVQMLINFGSGLYENLAYSILTLLGLIWVMICKMKYISLGVKAGIFVSFILLAVGIYCGGRAYGYYSLILSPFSVLGLLPLCTFSGNRKHRYGRQFGILMTGIALVLCIFYARQYANDTAQLGADKSQMVQYRFSAIMHSLEKEPTLLNYGFMDGGFYTAADIIPSCKYFSILNIPLKEMQAAQDECLSSGEVSFAVTRNSELNTQLFNKYKLVSTDTFYTSRYYLYYRSS